MPRQRQPGGGAALEAGEVEGGRQPCRAAADDERVERTPRTFIVGLRCLFDQTWVRQRRSAPPAILFHRKRLDQPWPIHEYLVAS